MLSSWITFSIVFIAIVVTGVVMYSGYKYGWENVNEGYSDEPPLKIEIVILHVIVVILISLLIFILINIMNKGVV